MAKKRSLLLILLLVILAILLILKFISFPKTTLFPQIALTEEQKYIVEIASEKTKSLGYNLDELSVFYDTDNKIWIEGYGSILANKETPEYEKLYSILEGRNYQAVYYYHRPSKHEVILGGSVWILVDKETKEVIFVQREK